MPYGSVQLLPGVNTERTPTALQAGYSASSLIRFRDGLAQKYGGWTKFFTGSASGTPRALHAWQDLNTTNHLAVGTTSQLAIITSGSLRDITPQTITTNPAPSFDTTLGSPTVTVHDAGISNVTVFDAVLFNTPVSVGGIILSGIYQIQTISSATSYTVTAATNATANVALGGAVPTFTTTSGSNTVQVNLSDHGRAVNDVVVFPISTTGNGVTIYQHYSVSSIVSANAFDILVTAQASASSTFSMNAGNVQIVYYINLGPPSSGTGYGFGGYGSGGYGSGGTSGSTQVGTPITATDWTLDNWGEILLACPAGGGIYTFNPTSGGFLDAALIEPAPTFNDGIFVSISQQILIAWGSTQKEQIGIQQDPMLIRWSVLGDFTNFLPETTNQAGSFRLPIGSKIVSGMAAVNQNLIWTDLDLWAMNYQGPPFVYGFNKIGAGAGLISRHAAQQLRGGVYWMGPKNFYQLTGNGMSVIPCPVWDAVFQNINISYTANVRVMPNTPFNEVGWLYPSTASSSGECDSYVKFNITEQGGPWDYGMLSRSAWIDQSSAGTPIAASPGGVIYQHELTNDADGAPMTASFQTGWFYIAEGEDFAFVDQVLPDMRWGSFNGAQTASIVLTFDVTNYPGDAPVSYGPYTVTQATEYVPVRFRGRQMRINLQSSDLASFWRIGRIRYRWALSGRR